MNPYMVSYDLNRPGQDYTALIQALEQIGAVKVLYSQWILRTTYSAEQLRNYLWQFMDGNDSLLVTRLSGEAAWIGMRVTHERLQQLLAA